MITEANQYEVLALAKQIERSAVRFSALSVALSSVRNVGDAASVSEHMRAEQNVIQVEFLNLASLLSCNVVDDAENLRKTIEQIAAPRDCGCSPACQCDTEESLKIEVDYLKDLARSALNTVGAS